MTIENLASDDPLIDVKKAAEQLGVTVSTLEAWRLKRRYNLPYVKIGRCVKYRQSAITKFIESNTVGA